MDSHVSYTVLFICCHFYTTLPKNYGRGEGLGTAMCPILCYSSVATSTPHFLRIMEEVKA